MLLFFVTGFQSNICSCAVKVPGILSSSSCFLYCIHLVTVVDTFLKSLCSKPNPAIFSNSSRFSADLFWKRRNMNQHLALNQNWRHLVSRYKKEKKCNIWIPTSLWASLLLGSSSKTFWKQRMAATALPNDKWHLPSRRWPCGKNLLFKGAIHTCLILSKLSSKSPILCKDILSKSMSLNN